MRLVLVFLLITFSFNSLGKDLLSLKNQIIKISKQNIDRLDNFSDIRSKLNPLVEELRKLQSLTAEESKRLKVGTWKQLWTDDADDLRANNRFQRAQRDETYQIVFSDGLFYNLTVLKTPIGSALGFHGYLQPKSKCTRIY